MTAAQLNLLDSHDTARFLTSVGGDQTALGLAWLFVCTLPGAPCLYYGDEIGLRGGPDPDCRKAFAWDPEVWDHGLREHVKDCIALRRRFPVLRHGSFARRYAADGVYMFQRSLEAESLVVAFNVAGETRRLDVSFLEAEGRAAAWQVVWGDRAGLSLDGGRRTVAIAPRSALVLQRV